VGKPPPQSINGKNHALGRLCRYAKALGVRFEEGTACHELHELHEGEVPWVVYGEAPQAYKEPTQAEACAAWLLEALEEAGEPMRPKEVVAPAKEYGFPRATVRRAREKLSEAIKELACGWLGKRSRIRARPENVRKTRHPSGK
jgi:hypothetical protein